MTEKTSTLIKGGRKLTLGSGGVKLPDFLSVDIDQTHSPDYTMDIRSLSFEPGSVDVIYASHVLEHLRQDEDSRDHFSRWDYLISILKSWRECLSDQGTLYIAVPDINKLNDLLLRYQDNSAIQTTVLDAMFGGARNQYDFHYSGFTRNLMTSLLERAGFSAIEEFTPFVQDESGHKICGESISLNLKASKGTEASTYKPPAQGTEQVSDLQMYIRAADERLQEILLLKKECELRLDVITKQSETIAYLQSENARLSRTVGSRVVNALNKLRR